MELLILLLILLGLWSLFIWLCSEIGGWVGRTLYDVLHSGQASQDAKQNGVAMKDGWKTKINEGPKKGESRSRR